MVSPTRRWMRRPCTIVNPGGDTGATDDMGDPIASPATRMRSLCEVQQTSASEDRTGGTTDVQKWNVFLPPADGDGPGPRVAGAGTDHGTSVLVTTSTSLELDDGRVFAFDGGPWDARHPRTGALSHVEAVARLVL